MWFDVAVCLQSETRFIKKHRQSRGNSPGRFEGTGWNVTGLEENKAAIDKDGLFFTGIEDLRTAGCNAVSFCFLYLIYGRIVCTRESRDHILNRDHSV